MTRHKYPRWLGFSPIWVIAAGAVPILVAYFVDNRILWFMANVIGGAAVLYLLIRQMLYPWGVGIVEWIQKKRK